MSHVSTVSGKPHIVEGGTHDEENKKCSIVFFLYGKKFRVSAHKDDVNDSDFYEDWKLLMQHETIGLRDAAGPVAVFDRWHKLCKLIITQSEDTLERLAPEQIHWKTLQEYLHTPSYELKLIADRDARKVEAVVISGPQIEPAYDLQPIEDDTTLRELEAATSSLPRYIAKDLRVLHVDQEWTLPPRTVQAPDGTVFTLEACRKPTKDADTGREINRPLDKIWQNLAASTLATADDTSHCAAKGVVLDVRGCIAGVLLAYQV